MSTHTNIQHLNFWCIKQFHPYITICTIVDSDINGLIFNEVMACTMLLIKTMINITSNYHLLCTHITLCVYLSVHIAYAVYIVCVLLYLTVLV